jgi:hypothetical protein
MIRRRVLAVLGAFTFAVPIGWSAQTQSGDPIPPGDFVPGAPAGPAPPAQGGAPNNPAERAARLSYLDGAVSVLPTGAKEWSRGFANRPLSSGDQLWSDVDGRAEIELGGAVVRVSSRSEISLLDFSSQGLQLGVGVGTINVALHSAQAGESFEIDTPEVAMSLQHDGDYRISVGLDGATTVLVRSGSTHLSNRAGEGITLRDGQGVVFAADGTLDVADAQVADSFDRWSSQRDAQWQRENAAQSYVSQEVPGAEQLNDSGQWSNQPDNGDVWFPNDVPPGWAPYQNGRWAQVPPWGWTWIDKAAWGFAPFHYGHWANFNGRWGWVPPQSNSHPTFAAASVPAPNGLSAPLANRALRVNSPPPGIANRPMIAMHAPLPASASVSKVIVTAASSGRASVYNAPYAAPVGPTIYARNVRPQEHQLAPDMPMPPLVHAAATAPIRTSSVTVAEPAAPALVHMPRVASPVQQSAKRAPQSAASPAGKPPATHTMPRSVGRGLN